SHLPPVVPSVPPTGQIPFPPCCALRPTQGPVMRACVLRHNLIPFANVLQHPIELGLSTQTTIVLAEKPIPSLPSPT
ncbi:unnamed protein product, partial [Closterium sp. Naga37s-1]